MSGGNAQPQFTARGDVQSAFVTAANTNSDGTGNIGTPTMYVLYTPGANDSYIETVRVMGVASSAGATLSATVIRLYISTVNTGATTNANTHLIAEIAIPTYAVNNATAATPVFDWPVMCRLAGSGAAVPQYLLVSSHVAAGANTGYQCTAFGGDY